MPAVRTVGSMSIRRLPFAAASLLLAASAAFTAAPPSDTAKTATPPSNTTNTAAPPTPHIVGGLMYAAPGAPPFHPGTEPGVWVRDVAPSAPAPSIGAPAPGRAATGFFSPRMTYLMPDGWCAYGPPLPPARAAAKPAGKAAARPGKPGVTVKKGAGR